MFKSAFEKFSQAPKSGSWRDRLLHIVHTRAMAVALAALLVVDLVLVITCLELQIFSEEALLSEHERCGQLYLDGAAVPNGLNTPLNNQTNLPVCKIDKTMYYYFYNLEVVLAWVSVSILCTFMLENLVVLVCKGLAFFTDIFYLTDLVVVTISIVFEVLFLIPQTKYQLRLVVGLLVFARTWRFARIAHGFYFLEHGVEHSKKSGHDEESGSHGGKASSSPKGTEEVKKV